MTATTITVGPGTSASELQTIIDNAPAGATIKLGAGTFTFTETVTVARNDISLIGAGSGETIIIADEKLGDDPAIQVGHDLHSPETVDTYSLAASAAAGDTAIDLAEGHDVQAGDFLYLTQDNTDELFDAIGDEEWRKDKDLTTILVEVASVDGNTVTLTSALNFDFDPALTEVQERVIVEDVTIGGFTVQGGWGEPDASDFSNTIGNAKGASMIIVAGTSGTVVTDIAIEDAASHGLTLADSREVTVTGLTVDGSHNKGTGGNGYGVWIRDVYDSTLSGLEITDTRHAVLFASYSSATGNTIEVDYTNRDINFHGGLDQDNTVTVHTSLRTGDEVGYMGSTLFFNEGESYGAPTDPDANTVTFDYVTGTVRADLVYASDEGAVIATRKSADVVYTGAGDDKVSLGSGHDVLYASGGDDTVYGGKGDDTVYFAGSLDDYQTYRSGSVLVVSGAYGETRLVDVDYVVFDGTELDADSVGTTAMAIAPVFQTEGGDDFADLTGNPGWEREYSDVSALMGTNLNALTLTGTGEIDAVGNDMRNHMMGNAADNRLEGAGGNDRMLGMHGDDIVLGEAGDDFLHGGYGDDTLVGGEGSDLLTGHAGADTFVGTEGENVVLDFDLSEGDRLVFNCDPEDRFAEAFETFREGGTPGDGFTFTETTYDSADSLLITSALGEQLLLAGVTAEELYY
ncbi:hypothetical protein [Psychromarinibacter sp. S121]|uniref:hypothetical protein n=1 Tax=Psychromarinibacter sp. S121 TaxID=3415127 RepID=UPI003C7B3D3C